MGGRVGWGGGSGTIWVRVKLFSWNPMVHLHWEMMKKVEQKASSLSPWISLLLTTLGQATNKISMYFFFGSIVHLYMHYGSTRGGVKCEHFNVHMLLLLLHPMIHDFCNPCEPKKNNVSMDDGLRVSIKPCSSSFRVFNIKTLNPLSITLWKVSTWLLHVNLLLYIQKITCSPKTSLSLSTLLTQPEEIYFLTHEIRLWLLCDELVA